MPSTPDQDDEQLLRDSDALIDEWVRLRRRRAELRRAGAILICVLVVLCVTIAVPIYATLSRAPAIVQFVLWLIESVVVYYADRINKSVQLRLDLRP